MSNNSLTTSDSSNQNESEINISEKNGLIQEDGIWHYYVDGHVDYSYCGLVEHNGNYYYVENGNVDFHADKLVEYQNQYWFVENGKVNFKYEGIFYDSDIYQQIVYIRNGLIATDFTGIAYYKETDNHVDKNLGIYISNGFFDENYEGLAKYNNNYYYVQYGYVSYDYTGLIKFNDIKYYISNGILDTSYNGVYRGYDYDEDCHMEYYVSNGKVDKTLNTLAYDSEYDKWCVVSNGLLNDEYSGLYLYDGSYYYIDYGEVNWEYTGLYYDGVNYYYINKGILDWSYSGVEEYLSEDDSGYSVFNKYLVKNGIVSSYTGLNYSEDSKGWLYFTNGRWDEEFTGLTNYYDVWYYVTNGILNWDNDDLVKYDNNYYYVQNGTINWNFTGIVENDDLYESGLYYVLNGSVPKNFSGYITENINTVNDVLTQTYEIINGICSGFTGVRIVDGTPYNFTYGSFNSRDLYIGYYAGDFYAFYGGTLAPWYTGGAFYVDPNALNNGFYYVENGKINWGFNGYASTYYNDQNYEGNYESMWNTAYFQNAQLITIKNDLYYTGNNWVYLNENGIVESDFCGLVEYYGNLYYVQNGYVNFDFVGGVRDYSDIYSTIVCWNRDHIDQNANGLYYYEDYSGKHYVLFKNGMVDIDFNSLYHIGNNEWVYLYNGISDTYGQQLVKFGNTYYYVYEGKLDWNANGIYEGIINYDDDFEYGYFAVQNGQLNPYYTDLYYTNLNSSDEFGNKYDMWAYIENGIQNMNETLVFYNGTWYYLNDGYIQWQDEGLIDFNGTKYYYNNGTVNWNYNGFIECYVIIDPDNYFVENYLVKNGSVDTSLNGLYFNDQIDEWYYVNNGKVNNDYVGLIEQNGAWYYVESGMIQWNYSGLVEYLGNEYYVNKGIVDFNYTGIVFEYNEDIDDSVLKPVYGGVYQNHFTGVIDGYYFIDSAFQLDYSGAVNINDEIFYINNGTINESYIGSVELNGQYYLITKGKFDKNYTGIAYSPEYETVYYIDGIRSDSFTGFVEKTDYHFNLKTTSQYHFENGICTEWSYDIVDETII